MMPSLTASVTKNIGTQKLGEEIFVDRQLFHRKYQENDYLELPLYTSWDIDNLSSMLRWLSVKCWCHRTW